MTMDVKALAIGAVAVIVGLAVASALFGPTGFLKGLAGNKAAARL